jgi:hypothetical protein
MHKFVRNKFEQRHAGPKGKLQDEVCNRKGGIHSVSRQSCTVCLSSDAQNLNLTYTLKTEDNKWQGLIKSYIATKTPWPA